MRRTEVVLLALVAGLLIVTAGCETPNSAEPAAEPVVEAPKAEAPIEGSKAAPDEGAKADIYTLDAAAVTVAVGSKAEGAITITPASGYKINEMYPWSVDLKGGENLTVAESLKKDAWSLSKEKASVTFPVEAKAAGEGELTASVKFSICNEEKCELFKKDVSIKVAAN